eukprot:17136-Heterococcus_DN1.PRE.7
MDLLAIRGPRLFAGLVLFRVLNALILRTHFTPDEFWQGPEVARRLAFGQGHFALLNRTWEWLPGAQIRGFLHPLIFAALYKLLTLVQLDTAWAVAHGPKLLQSIGAAVCDYYTHGLALKLFGRDTAAWALLLQLASWFNFYCLCRPYSNSLEAVLTIVSLYYWTPLWCYEKQRCNSSPDYHGVHLLLASQHGKSSDGKPAAPTAAAPAAATSHSTNESMALLIAAVCVAVRPTSATLWAAVGLARLYRLPRVAWLRYLLCSVLPIVGSVLAVSTAIDRWLYGQWVFVPYQFLKFNVLDGKSALFGVQTVNCSNELTLYSIFHTLNSPTPWHWLFTQGAPAVLGASLPLFILGAAVAPADQRSAALLVLWFIAVHSISAHKEFRFLLPVLPLKNIYAGYGLQWLLLRCSSSSQQLNYAKRCCRR